MNKLELAIKLKELVGGPVERDFAYEFTVDRAYQYICDYCNIDTVPDSLETALLSMCIDIYRTENFGSSEGSKIVKSVTEGDVSVTYSSLSSDCPSTSFLKNYKSQLNKYRRVVW